MLLHISLQFHTCTWMHPCTPTPHLFLHCPIKLDIIINSIFSLECALLESYLEVADSSFSGRLGEYQEKMIQILLPPELDLRDAFRYNPAPPPHPRKSVLIAFQESDKCTKWRTILENLALFVLRGLPWFIFDGPEPLLQSLLQGVQRHHEKSRCDMGHRG